MLRSRHPVATGSCADAGQPRQDAEQPQAGSAAPCDGATGMGRRAAGAARIAWLPGAGAAGAAGAAAAARGTADLAEARRSIPGAHGLDDPVLDQIDAVV